jgi:nicotinate-nucleotide adenylyltransferase
MRRIGVFGGTFDPPHLGHLAVAEAARDSLELERVVFIPSGLPPHKHDRPVTPARHRVALTRLAVRGNPAFTVSTLETRRGGASYTVDTLRALRSAHPRTKLYLVIGEDSLNDLPSWHQPEEILSLATLAVARRAAPLAPGERRRARRVRLALPRVRRVVWLDSPLIEISSSALRARARRGASLRYLVPKPVEAYVLRLGLYRKTR